MKTFAEEVQRGRIKGPQQREFDSARWTEDHAATRVTETDDRLHQSGLWFHEEFSACRAALELIEPLALVEAKAKRAYVASLNRDWAVVMGRDRDHATEDGVILSGDSMIDPRFSGRDMAGMRVENVRVSETLQAIVDGARFFLSSTPATSTGTPDALRILRALIKHIHVASIYNALEVLWQACVWDQWFVRSVGDLVVIGPGAPDLDIDFEISHFREKRLRWEQLMRGRAIRVEDPELFRLVIKGTRVAVGFDRSQGKRRILVGNATEEVAENLGSAMPLHALDAFLDPIQKLPLPNSPALSVDKLLRAWLFFESLCALVEKDLPKDTAIEKMGKLWQFAPTFEPAELRTAISNAIDVNAAAAGEVIALFTFRDHKDDLWRRPLVPIAGKLLPLLPVFRTSNLTRVIESWLRETGFDLGDRGDLFEGYCRSEINARIQGSALAPLVRSRGTDLTVRENGASEQIDFACAFPNTVLIGECKAMLFPESAKERHNARTILSAAAAQAKRKAEFCTSHREAFSHASGWQIDTSTRFVPVVISSCALYVGRPIDGVPVVDVRILARFFDGFLEGGLFEAGKGFTEWIRRKEFYKDPGDAEGHLVDYLLSPPQTTELIKSLKVTKKDFLSLRRASRVLQVDVEVVPPTLIDASVIEEQRRSTPKPAAKRVLWAGTAPGGNYGPIISRLNLPPGARYEVQIEHDSWCEVLKEPAGVCNCDPYVALVEGL
ncbi:MAG: hypothetical protein H6708_22370 [Kofleriaceae bacterium]|nr:hypothetical protein [Myxococcales bacterium]MCB9563152.1 hypothetical protein [Kofleriaceae bacterium]